MDLKVTAVLRKGVAADSTDVLLKVEDRAPFHVGLDYNNYGNRFVGQNRVGLGVFGGNLLTQGDNASLRAFLPFPSSSSPFYQAAYNVGLNNQGTRVGVSYANAALTVGQELAVLDIRSRANVYTAFASHPLTRTEAASSTVAGGLSFKDFNNTVLGIPSSHDRVRSLNLGLSGDFVGGGGKNIYALLLTQGLGGFGGGTRRGDPLASRAGASNAFTRLNVDLARIQKLSKLFLILRAAGQMAMDPLLVGEQFSLGGFDTVRGYRQSDFLGDSGYVLGGELRVPFSESPRHNVQGAVFIDHGHASLRSPAAGQLGSKSLTGVGVGLRASFKDNTAIRLDVGFPLSRPASSARKETVFYGQLTHTF
jgi:hemolysin activation/secretion protein